MGNILNNLNNGYRVKPRNEKKPKQLSHLFYMDELKLYSPNVEETEKEVRVVKTFTDDLGMEFGLDKCAFMNI